MKKIPKMTSTKDLAYISDMFNWNMIIINKIDFYTPQIEDKDLIVHFKEVRDMHYKNANELIKLLKGANE